MSVFLRRNLLNCRNFRKLFSDYRSGGLYEPSYLEGMKPKYPLYDTINIQLKGYDYPVLESYQKLLHNLLKNMDVNVENSWALPAQDFHITTYKPKSEEVNAEYKLKIYERNVQITDTSTLQMSMVLRTIEVSLPAGVTAEVRPHQEEDEEVRYVPDTELVTLKDQLETLGGPSKKK